MDALLCRLYPHHTNKELEKITGWKVKELQYRAGRLGLVKTKETECRCLTKIEYVADHENFIRENFEKYTNKELAAMLGFKLHFIRIKCHAMGLYRMELEYWTEEQVQFLEDNYQLIGDKELAEIFNSKWEKKKTWTFKHIEKKRLYLKLKRTKEQISAIHDRNVENGRFANCPVNRWLVHGVFQEGDVRMWRISAGRYVPFIKINNQFVHWARYTWEKEHGPVGPGINIIFKNDDPYSYPLGIEVLEALTNEQLSRRNNIKSSQGLSDNYIAGILSRGHPDLRESIRQVPELLELKRQELLLNRAIKEQNGRSKR
jgi:hypothetical protein